MIADLIRSNRTCRRFDEDHGVTGKTLSELVNLARLSASAGNLQPLKYILSNTPETNQRIFTCLKWAGYLKDWDGPEPGERPAAYVVMLGDTGISANIDCDHGIAAQSILLGAREKGLAGCILAAINHPKLRGVLDIPSHCKILLVLAIGKPKEEVVIDHTREDGDIRYWRDDQHRHHVPKRQLEDIVIARYVD